MALNKVPYVDGVTVITAENLNDIQDAIIALENAPAQGLTEDMKQALLQIARKVAYIDDQGQTYYDDLYDAFYPPKTVVLITAVFEQGSTVIYDDTALNDLKQYLTVTAKYDDNTTAILADSAYTLSGLLEAGTSTVTVAYNGLTTTFTVNVTARPTLSSISAVYTQSGAVYNTDTLDSLKADLVVTAAYSDSSTQTVPAADYTLSGTLTAGTSTITVSYGGKTDAFTVYVMETVSWDIEWDASKGSPLNNGFTGTNGAMNGDYYVLTPTSSALANIARSPNFNSANGILEITVNISSLSTNNKFHLFNMPKLRVLRNAEKLYFVTAVGATQDQDTLEEIYSNVTVGEMTLRIAYNATSGATIFLNGFEIYTWTGALPYDTTRFLVTANSGSAPMYIKAIRLKANT